MAQSLLGSVEVGWLEEEVSPRTLAMCLTFFFPLLQRVFLAQLTHLPHGDEVPIVQETVSCVL